MSQSGVQEIKKGRDAVNNYQTGKKYITIILEVDFTIINWMIVFKNFALAYYNGQINGAKT